MIRRNMLIAMALSAAALAGSRPATAEPVTYKIDTGNSSVSFTVTHMLISKVRGSFNTFEGTIVYDPDRVESSSVQVSVAAGSIDTNNDNRDKDLKGDDFLGVEKYPSITFKSTSIRKTEDGMVAVGELSLRGVTKTVEMPFELKGPIMNPWGHSVIGVTGEFTINRQEYGVSWNQKLDNGGLVVSDDVTLEFSVEAK